MWRPSPSLGQAGQVWTGTFPNLGDYGPPPGLCFDWFCQSSENDPVQADRSLEDYNLDAKVERVVSYALEQAAVTKGDPATMNIMWYLGSDFQYDQTRSQYDTQLPHTAAAEPDVAAPSVPVSDTRSRVNGSTAWTC